MVKVFDDNVFAISKSVNVTGFIICLCFKKKVGPRLNRSLLGFNSFKIADEDPSPFHMGVTSLGYIQ